MTRLRALICRYLHRGILHPVNGFYRCRVCLREWPVPWGEA